MTTTIRHVPVESGHTNRPREERLLQPVAENAYRLLGLGAGASQREIYEAAAASRRALKLERVRRTPWDARWLSALDRTENAVRDALGRLARPPQRIYERLFWFYETENACSDVSRETCDARVAALLAQAECATARHDAALLAYACALRFDAQLSDRENWTRALRLWRELVEREEFWSQLLAMDLRGEFEQTATHSEIRDLRGRALRLVSAPLVELAKDAVREGDYALCRRALAVLDDASLPPRLRNSYEAEILGPLEDAFESLCKEMLVQFAVERFKVFDDNGRIRLCNQTLSKFKDEIRPRLRRIVELAGAESRIARRVCETGASALRQIAAALPASQQTVARRLLEKAWLLAPPACEAQLFIEAALRDAGRGDFIRERTEAEYYESLPAQLRPQTEVFASYVEETSATAIDDAGERDGCISSALAIGFMFVLLVLCNVCDKQRPARRVNFNVPDTSNIRPTIQYDANLNLHSMPTARLDPSYGVPSLDAAELRRKLKRGRAIVVDVRSRAEFESGHIPGARSIPEDDLAARAAGLPRRTQIVVYADARNFKSYSAALLLNLHGFKNVAILDGGYDAWRDSESIVPPPLTTTRR